MEALEPDSEGLRGTLDAREDVKDTVWATDLREEFDDARGTAPSGAVESVAAARVSAAASVVAAVAPAAAAVAPAAAIGDESAETSTGADAGVGGIGGAFICLEAECVGT